MKSEQGIFQTTFVCRSDGVVDLGEANSCCRVLTGLLVAWMPLLLRTLVSGSVTPLMYGKTTRPFWESGGSVHLKNIPPLEVDKELKH